MHAITRFVTKIKMEYPELYNKGRFCIKLPFASGGVIRDKASVKYAVGVKQIIKRIQEFMNNHPACYGYIHFVIVQPRFANNSEAKVISFIIHV
jgi:hypothetical protein